MHRWWGLWGSKESLQLQENREQINGIQMWR